MFAFKYLIARILAKFLGDEIYSRLFRKHGMSVGENCHIYSNVWTSESYLISIGDNVTISNDVQFITHDNSVCKVYPDKTDVFGEIFIGNNCFIGAKSIIMYGVHIPDNTIIAAGSVVAKSIQVEGQIWGGNPARIISDWDGFGKKVLPYTLNIDGLKDNEKRRLIKESAKIVR